MTIAPPVSDLVADARALREVLLANASQSEKDRRLTPESVAALEGAGIFSMAMPQSWGGAEADPFVQYEVIESLSGIDGSAGWCSMIGCDGGYLSAFMPEATGRELFADISKATVFVAGPGGVAVEAEGGYVVTGQWAFASGSSHAAVFALMAIEATADGARMGPEGIPVVRLCLFEAGQVNVLDTWHTTGLCSTASNDVAVNGVFVPADRTFTFPPAGDLTHPGPLYRWPMMFVTKAAGVYVGIAAAAIEDFLKLAATKTAFGTTNRLRELGSVQYATANAVVSVDAARAGFRQVLEDLWGMLNSGEKPDATMGARVFGMMGLMSDLSEQVVTDIYHLSGRDGLLTKNPLERRFRDIVSAKQHVLASVGTREATGRVFLGMPSGSMLI